MEAAAIGSLIENKARLLQHSELPRNPRAMWPLAKYE